MEISALNKESRCEGLELVRGTNGSQSEDKGNSGPKQNKAAGEGLELVRGTNGVNRETNWGDRGHSGAKQNKAAIEGLEIVRGTNGSQSEDKGNCAQYKTKLLQKAWN